MTDKIITEAAGAQCFWINNGPVVKNLPELRQALSEISDETFAYHTKRDGNNFAAWIEEVLGEPGLAKKLARLKTKKAQIKAIDKFLA